MFDVIRRALFGHAWERHVAMRAWPVPVASLLAAIEGCGFSAAGYHQGSPDLVADLQTSDMAAIHFLRFLEDEVVYLRPIPVRLDFEGLARLTALPIANRRFVASLVRNLVQGQIDDEPLVALDADFWRKTLEVLASVGRPVVIAGDSHSMIFRHTGVSRRVPIVPINLVRGGASALGLARKASRSGYGNNLGAIFGAFRLAMAQFNQSVPACFVFGQVDLEFVYTFRSLRDGRTEWDDTRFSAFCAESISSYVAWIASLDLPRAIVVGVNPPCLRDDMVLPVYEQQMRFYQRTGVVDEDGFDDLLARLPQMHLPNQRKRTQNHRLFNRLLADEAQRRGLIYVDTFDAMLGPDGLLDRRYSSTINGSDIHVGGPDALRLKARLLEEVMRKAVE